MDWKGCHRKWSWPNLTHHSRTVLGVRKTTTSSAHIIGVSGKNETWHLRTRVFRTIAWANLFGEKTYGEVVQFSFWTSVLEWGEWYLQVSAALLQGMEAPPTHARTRTHVHTSARARARTHIHTHNGYKAGWIQSQLERAKQEDSISRSEIESLSSCGPGRSLASVSTELHRLSSWIKF